MPSPGGKPGQACVACARAHAKCSYKEERAESEISAGVEEVRKVVREEIRREVSGDLTLIKRRITSLEKEVWNVLKGVGGKEEKDGDWEERWEVLQNWELWGVPGSGYEHLPGIKAEDLVRKMEDETELAEVEVDPKELEEEEAEEVVKTKGKGKAKAKERDEDRMEE